MNQDSTAGAPKMQTSERNVNINIRDNRGIATLAGFVIVIILTRLWWTGLLTDMFQAAYSPSGEGMTSATYMIVAFIANLIYGIGTVFVLIWSGIWWMILDVVQAIRQYAAERAAKQQVEDGIATEEMYDAAGQNPMIEILETIESNMQTIADKIDEIDARVTMVEEQPKPAPRTTRAKA